jgi:hypothetical protein
MNCRLLLSKLGLLLLPVIAFGTINNNTTGAFCGWDPSWEDSYYPIIDQYALVHPEFHAFLNCPDTPFCDAISNDVPSGNLQEWVTYFKGELTEEELIELMYKRPLEWLMGENGFDVYEDDLDKKISSKKMKFFKQYLILARKTETTSSDQSGGRGWYQGERYEYEEPIRIADKRELLSKALELAAKAPDDFMRNRAGFQAVKMAHYLQENEAAIRYFNTILKKVEGHSYIYYRAMEEMAGAAYNQNLQVLAAISYLEVYNQLPDRRNTCGISLRFLNWELLSNNSGFEASSENSDVKSFFKAFHGRGDVIKEMENMARDNVNSPYLEVLAVRLLDQMQSSIFEHNSAGYYDYNDPSEDYLRQLHLFTKSILHNKKLKNQDLWSLVLTTTYLYQNKNALALSYMKTLNPGSKYLKHFKRLKAAVQFMSIKSLDRQRINQSYEVIAADEDLRTHQPTVVAFFNHISALYSDSGNPITSVLASIDYDAYSSDALYDWAGIGASHAYSWEYNSKYHYLSEEYINNFDVFVCLPNPTKFEKTIMQRMKTLPKDYVHDLRGTYYMRQDRLEAAVKEFKKVKRPEVFWEKEVRTELFSASIKEYMNVPFTSISNNYQELHADVLGDNAVIVDVHLEREDYRDNKIKLSEIIIKLKQLAQIHPDKAADYYYMIGNAWYNMSQKGWFMNNSYYIGNDHRNSLGDSSDADDDVVVDRIDSSFILEQANTYLLKALLSENGSRETKAAVLFMLAKTNSCEDGSYNLDTDTYEFNICEEHKEYFDQLKQEYSDTAYYNEVLKECSWFKNYVELSK